MGRLRNPFPTSRRPPTPRARSCCARSASASPGFTCPDNRTRAGFVAVARLFRGGGLRHNGEKGSPLKRRATANSLPHPQRADTPVVKTPPVQHLVSLLPGRQRWRLLLGAGGRRVREGKGNRRDAHDGECENAALR